MLVNKKVINRDKFYMFVFPDAADIESAKKAFNVATFKTETPEQADVDRFFETSVDSDRMPEEICELLPVETSTDPDPIVVLRGELQAQLTATSDEIRLLSDRVRVLEVLSGN